MDHSRAPHLGDLDNAKSDPHTSSIHSQRKTLVDAIEVRFLLTLYRQTSDGEHGGINGIAECSKIGTDDIVGT